MMIPFVHNLLLFLVGSVIITLIIMLFISNNSVVLITLKCVMGLRGITISILNLKSGRNERSLSIV